MANADRPKGFWPAYTLHGGPPHMRRIPKCDNIIFKGDMLMLSTSEAGSVTPLDGTTKIIVGVAAEHSTAAGSTSTPEYINVYDDLRNTIFGVQADGSEFEDYTDTMLRYDAVVTAASTCDSNETSIMEIDSSASMTDGCLYIIEKIDRPDNAWGEFAEMYCKILAQADEPASVGT